MDRRALDEHEVILFRTPAELHRWFRAHHAGASWAWWTKAPPGYRRLCTWWVASAKRTATQESRLATLVDCCARGVRVPPLAQRSGR